MFIYISQSSGRSFINRFEIFIDIWLIFYINICFYIQHQFDYVDHSTVSVEVMFDVCFALLEYDDTILIALGINLKYTIESEMHVLVPRKRWKMQWDSKNSSIDKNWQHHDKKQNIHNEKTNYTTKHLIKHQNNAQYLPL